MYPCIIVISLAFFWLSLETNFFTIRLLRTSAVSKFTIPILVDLLEDLKVFCKECGEHALVCASGLGLVLVFSAIAITGRFWFEDQNWILYSELSMSIAILSFGLYKVIKYIKSLLRSP